MITVKEQMRVKPAMIVGLRSEPQPNRDIIGYAGKSGSIANRIEDWQNHLHLTIYRGSTANKYNRINPIDYTTTKFDKNNGNKIK